MIDYPPIVVPKWILRAFIRENRFKYNFVYADDLTHAAYQGQASQCIGEGNTFPIPTKKRNCKEDRQCFYDHEFDILTKYYIDRAFAEVPRNLPIIPFPHIGEGEAKLPQYAPKTLAYIQAQIKAIEYPNIIWVDKL